jgi:hypothetical protein
MAFVIALIQFYPVPKAFCFFNGHKYTIALGEPEPLLVPW